MDNQLIISFVKLIIFLPFIIFLIYLCLKVGGSKLNNLQNSKYIKILEKVPVSKDANLLVVKMGRKGYVMSSTNQKMEIISEIDSEDLAILEKNKGINQYKSLKDLIEKLKNKKEGKDEEKKEHFNDF